MTNLDEIINRLTEAECETIGRDHWHKADIWFDRGRDALSDLHRHIAHQLLDRSATTRVILHELDNDLDSGELVDNSTSTAVCERCEQSYRSDTCRQNDSWPWGQEPERDPIWREANGWPPADTEPAERCPDCGVHLGGSHHVGCVQSRCIRCQRQDFADRGCGCTTEEPTDGDHRAR